MLHLAEIARKAPSGFARGGKHYGYQRRGCHRSGLLTFGFKTRPQRASKKGAIAPVSA
jgi:hypothetical protein